MAQITAKVANKIREPKQVKGNFSGGHLLEWLLVGMKDKCNRIDSPSAVPLADLIANANTGDAHSKTERTSHSLVAA